MKVTTLTATQEKCWEAQSRRQRENLCTASADCDRDFVEGELLKIYDTLKLDPPQIIWCQSPRSMILMPPIVDQLVRDKLRQRTFAWLAASLHDQVWSNVWGEFETQLPKLKKLATQFQYRQSNPMWLRTGAPISQRVRDMLLKLVADSDAQIRALVDSELLKELSKRTEEEIITPMRLGVRVPLRASLEEECARGVLAIKAAHGALIRSQICTQPLPKPGSALLSGVSGRRLIRLQGQLDAKQCSQFSVWADSRLASQFFDAIRHYWTMLSLGWLRRLVFLNDCVLPTRLPPEIDIQMQAWTALSEQLFGIIFFENVVFVSECPTACLLDDRRRLHAENGPALEFRDGFRLHAWHGTLVPVRVIESSSDITAADIESENNAEVRRVMLERFGHAKYLTESGSLKIQEDEFGQLYRKQIADDEPLVMVRLKNSTPEPDGTWKYYFLRVPPETATAREAVAWTFGMNEESYRPVKET